MYAKRMLGLLVIGKAVIEWAKCTLHRLSKTSEEAVGVGVSRVVDSDLGMTVLCRATILEYCADFWQDSRIHAPRIVPPATFSELIIQAISWQP